MNDEPLVTRRELVELVRSETGIPITYSRLMKDGAAGNGPQPAAQFGKQYLYKRTDAITYAKSLIRPAMPKT